MGLVRNPPKLLPPPKQRGLKWTEELYDIVPTWTEEPDQSIMKTLLLPHLPHAHYDLNFFAQGAFNKLYLLSPSPSGSLSESESFIMRVALPVDPHLKTACEVATLDYISRYTSIPVPRVIAHDDSASNPLGFEWILMTRLPGIPVEELWSSPALTYGERVLLTKTIARYVLEMRTISSNMMGSLYHSTWKRPEAQLRNMRSSSTSLTPSLPALHPDFVVGPICAPSFFYGDRIRMAADRGPWGKASAWLEALLNLNVDSFLHTRAGLLDDADKDDVTELDGRVAAAESLRELLQSERFDFSAGAQGSSRDEVFVLCHEDLSTTNILIDPHSHVITGIVDWESAAFVPLWKAKRVPHFLDGPVIVPLCYEVNFRGPIPTVPPPPDEKEDEELRDYIEKFRLREVYLDALKLGGGDQVCGREERIYENKVGMLDVEGRWEPVLHWASGVSQGQGVETEVDEGDGLFFWPEQ